MASNPSRNLALAAVIGLLAIPAAAQHEHHQKAGEAPAMTPEQQAMMEAYQKAGTPGEAHKALAAQERACEVAP